MNLFGADLDVAIAALSTHSLRVGLTARSVRQWRGRRADRQVLRWPSTATALRYGRKPAPSSNAAARMLRKVRG
nr:hypothetical protein [Novosphingobium sp. UBA1939]